MFNNYYVADFENTTGGDETYIYGAAICQVDVLGNDFSVVVNNEVHLFEDIDSFMNFITKLPSKTVCYFHNLSGYDGWIIVYWLLDHGWEFTTDKNVNHRFTGIITDDRRIYQLKVRFGKYFVEFRDTALLIQGKLDTIGKNFKCNTAKLVGTIDYDKPRTKGYKMTDVEKQYLRNDVVLLAEILKKALTMGGLTNYLTAGSFAFNEMKHSLYQTIHNKSDYDMECFRLNKFYKKDLQDCYRAIFPELPFKLDEKLRHAYKGGYCINWSDGEPYYGHGVVLDYNSLYPSCMISTPECGRHPYPYGYSKYNGAGFLPDCDCFIIHIEARFKVKENHLPFIQIKGSRFFLENEYIREVKDEVELYLTSVDYKLFHDMYDVYYEDIIESWSFDSTDDIFNKFIIDHYEMKKNAKDKTTRQTAKIILNSSYGKFGTRIMRYTTNKLFIKDNGLTGTEFTAPKCKSCESCPKACDGCYNGCKDYNPVQPTATYIPVACFVTAYGRDKIIRSAMKVIEKYGSDALAYIDTDSLHLKITREQAETLFDLDPKEIGFLACESEFDGDEANGIASARWVRQKTYVERNVIEDGQPLAEPKINIKACGLTDDGKAILMEDQDLFLKFTFGLKIEGAKLMAHTVKGGKNLHRVDFQIRG